ncbi:unnamed protein product [Angiostrongylus costaricensis]|uniref:Secreted protein n=1 Tax=Angiostrongylus costaricensis TaxID=334426 RepID=A0A0R3PJS8_ANGCS|nr:unnamed protein product [Angiostrongylus costaricensis]
MSTRQNFNWEYYRRDACGPALMCASALAVITCAMQTSCPRAVFVRLLKTPPQPNQDRRHERIRNLVLFSITLKYCNDEICLPSVLHRDPQCGEQLNALRCGSRLKFQLRTAPSLVFFSQIRAKFVRIAMDLSKMVKVLGEPRV